MNRINCRVYFSLFSAWLGAACIQAAPPPATPAAPPPIIIIKPTRITFHQAWNEVESEIVVPFTNEGRTDLKLIGVQSTGGLYVESYPQKIKTGGTENFKLLYLGRPQVEGTVDLVRIHTNQGERLIEVVHAQDDAVTFSTHEVKWKVGDPAISKDVLLKVVPNTVKIVSVKASGGQQAELLSDGANVFRVRITPATTTKSKNFTVIVETDPALPGKSTVIMGSIDHND